MYLLFAFTVVFVGLALLLDQLARSGQRVVWRKVREYGARHNRT